MKTSISLFTILMTVYTMGYAQRAFDNEPEILKSQLIHCLKQDNEAALIGLFPTLDELYALMDENESLYSTTLNDAKAALSIDYENKILPQARTAFQHLLSEGKIKGIAWQAIKSMEIVSLNKPSKIMHIRFDANGTAFDVEVQLFTTANGRLKLTQFVKFI